MGPVLMRQIVRVAEAGGGHAGGGEQNRVRQVLPAFTGGCRGGDAAGGIAEIAVMIGGAEWVERLLVDLREDVVAVKAEIFQEVAGTRAQAAAMRHQIGDGGVLGDIRVAQREGRIVALRLAVPVDHTLAHEMGDDGRGDRLRHRGQQEHRVGIDLAGLAYFTEAEALGIDHLILVDDSDRQAREAGPLHGVGDDAVQCGRGLVDIGLVEQRRHRRHRRLQKGFARALRDRSGWQTEGERRGPHQGDEDIRHGKRRHERSPRKGAATIHQDAGRSKTYPRPIGHRRLRSEVGDRSGRRLRTPRRPCETPEGGRSRRPTDRLRRCPPCLSALSPASARMEPATTWSEGARYLDMEVKDRKIRLSNKNISTFSAIVRAMRIRSLCRSVKHWGRR